MFSTFAHYEGKGCSAHIKDGGLSSGSQSRGGQQGVLSLKAFAFLDCLGATEEKMWLKHIRRGENGEKRKHLKVLPCEVRVWKGNLHSPTRKIKMLIF